MAVSLGNDVDTTAALFGQFSGAYYEINRIPEKWISKIVHRDLMESFARSVW